VLVCLEVGRYPVLGTAVLPKHAAKNRADPFYEHFEDILSQPPNDPLVKNKQKGIKNEIVREKPVQIAKNIEFFCQPL